MRFALRVVVLAGIIYAVTRLVTGITVIGNEAGTLGETGTYLWVALLFAVVNSIVGPVVRLLSLPFVVLTLGLFLLVVNAALLGITAALAVGTALRYALVTRLGERVVADIRRAVFDRVIGLSPAFYERVMTGEIISRIERKAGWQITALELRTLDQDTLEQHYGEHKGKPFYEPLVEFMASGPVVALIVEGERVIEGVRALAGPTDPIAAAPGSIRGDYGVIVRENLIHASDSEESAEREVKIFFPGRA